MTTIPRNALSCSFAIELVFRSRNNLLNQSLKHQIGRRTERDYACNVGNHVQPELSEEPFPCAIRPTRAVLGIECPAVGVPTSKLINESDEDLCAAPDEIEFDDRPERSRRLKGPHALGV
jgi:hypothetical protein